MASVGTKITRYFFWLMTLAVMSLIFYLSSQTAEVSSAGSEGFIFKLLSTVSEKFRDMAEADKLALVESIHSPVRTVAHGATFFALGFSMFSAMCTYHIGWGVKFGVTLPFCLIYAVSDEYHQTFVAGRSAQLEDVAVDFIGAVAGVMIVFICVVICGAIRKRDGKMRKKELMMRLAELVGTVDSLSKENKELKNEIKALREELAETKAKPEKTSSPCASESETVEDAHGDEVCFVVKTVDEIDFGDNESEEALEDDMLEYGAGIIGDITVDAARCCDIITASGGPNVKDQLSLIMGKSEVAKGEILAIALSGFSYDKKREMIAAELDDAKLYFKSVCEQNKEI